ncbi:MAG: ABC transporter ATP-binding protein [Candidatus Omnitrophota bacterium]
MSTVLKMENITKSFGKKDVLKKLNFDIPSGSVVGLLGKNGAGKTTLMKCALGLIKAQSGQISILGEDAWNMSPSVKARLGYVAQQPSFNYWMRVGDVVNYTASFYPAWNTGMVNQLIRDWELDIKDTAVKLSEGQKQRLSIILALGNEPDLLILDEPAASLDPAARRQFLKTILDIVADRGCTVLFSSHITSDVERIADKVAFLNEGKIIFTGETDSLKDTVKLLKVIFNGTQPLPLDVPGMLRIRTARDQALIYVKDFNMDLKTQLEQRWDARIDIADLNLEEIFVEMTQ